MTPTEVESPRFTGYVRTIEGIRQNTHAKVLVVGHRGDNFPAPYHEHPQLLFWETDEANPDGLPAAVKMVLLTRFVNHSLYGKLADECARRNIVFCTKLMGTGEIKKLLAPLVFRGAIDEPEQAPRVTMETVVTKQEQSMEDKKKFDSGGAVRFVLEHGDVMAMNVPVEAERLAKLANAQGFTASSKRSMENTIYIIRRKQGMFSRRRRAVAAPVEKPQRGRRPKAVVPEEAPPTTVLVTGRLLDDDREIMRMLDDLVTAAGLIRETIAKRAERRAQVKELLAGL